MIRIALVEDEAEVRAQLQGYVQRHTRQYGTEFAVTEFADGMELLDDYRPVYDILFLDVEMKHLDGMETAVSGARIWPPSCPAVSWWTASRVPPPGSGRTPKRATSSSA